MTLREACEQFGAPLSGLVMHKGQPVDGPLLLWAIAGNESNYGTLREFARVETAYAPGGRYFITSASLQALYKRFGILACCSYGAFQIMAIVAQEMGFTGHPVDLQRDDTCAQYMARLIAERFIKRQGAKELYQLLDAYNSGSLRDSNVPKKYIADGVARYEMGWPT